MSSDLRNLLVVVLIALLAGVIGFVPQETVEVVSSGGGGGSGGSGPLVIEDEPAAGGPQTRRVGGSAGSAGSAGSSGQESAAGAAQRAQQEAAAQGIECAAGKNGGETDTGVSASKIGLASTIVTSGPGATFLKLSQFGMQAIRVKVNGAGGVCGRQLDLKLVNDEWDAQRGLGILKNFVNDPGIFALPVVPSSEGLRAADHEITQAGIPVVGTDGMLLQQYQNEWVWPVATATLSTMRIMAKWAYDKGARNFAIVYDVNYRFGVEGKNAYVCYLTGSGNDSDDKGCSKGGLSGAKVAHVEPIEPNLNSYDTNIQNLNSACGDDGCDAVAMLLDPGTANTWIKQDSKFRTRADFRLGAQPLFTNDFGKTCGAPCDGMYAFTGYVPPLESNTTKAGVKEYIQDLEAVRPGIDTSNQFLEGAYLGMKVFVRALEDAGPNLTREGVKEAMNGMTYESDLASTLSWRGSRFANQSAQVWQIKGDPSFQGFRDTGEGFLKDPASP